MITIPKIISTNFFWFFIFYLSFAYRSNLLERIIKVGAQSPTKMPNRSACAWSSGVFPPVRYQIPIEAAIDMKPSIKQRVLSNLRLFLFITLFYLDC